MSTDLNTNQFHEELIRQQGKQISDIAVGTNAQPSPLAPILATPFLGDGKVSRISGMNDKVMDKFQKRLESRTDPKKHREVGKKFAEYLHKHASNAFTNPKMIPVWASGSLAQGIVIEKARNDIENNVPMHRGLFSSAMTGMGAGLSAGLVSVGLKYSKPLARTALYMSVLGLSTPVTYALARKTKDLTDYAKDQFAGSALPTQTFPAHTSITKEI